jgi:hypothetical protein
VWRKQGSLDTDPGWAPGSTLRKPLVKVDVREWVVEDILDNLGWEGDLVMMDPCADSEWVDFDGRPLEPVNIKEFGAEAFTRVGKRLSQLLRHFGAMNSHRYCCPCDTGGGGVDESH